MIRSQAVLKVADNSGAVFVRCIHVCGSTGVVFAGLGDVVVVSVRSVVPNGKISVGQIHKAVVVRLRQPILRSDGTTVSSSDNAVVLVSKDSFEPIGTRVIGPVCREVRLVSSRVYSLAPEVF